MSFGKRLKQLREEKELTQEELGKIVNLSKPTISKYEKDIIEANNSTLTMLADFFKVSTDYLLCRTEEKESQETTVPSSYEINPIKTLGSIIKEYRTINNLSLRDFSEKCGVSHTYISQLEKSVDTRTGKPIEPTLDTVIKIAKALGKSTEGILIELGYIEDKANKDDSEILAERFLNMLIDIGEIKTKEDLTSGKALKILSKIFKELEEDTE
ncbi:helix-turn-helix domain-containing protein [Clostridium sp. WILCCON 0269]|uniref:Helix-turn-helix domain-containing protein n=1 Tax=Candidatus Clostridium eludens TaxID=3381663 RepID=A0ABW8SL06_9CLOT